MENQMQRMNFIAMCIGYFALALILFGIGSEIYRSICMWFRGETPHKEKILRALASRGQMKASELGDLVADSMGVFVDLATLKKRGLIKRIIVPNEVVDSGYENHYEILESGRQHLCELARLRHK
jgi:hypothetical protein